MSKVQKVINDYKVKLIEKFGTGFYNDPINLFLLGVLAVGLLAIFLLLIFRAGSVSTSVPASYNIIYGVTSTGSVAVFYGYLLAAALFCFVNTVIAWILFEKERILSYLLLVVSFVIQLVFFLYLFNLTSLIQ